MSSADAQRPGYLGVVLGMCSGDNVERPARPSESIRRGGQDVQGLASCQDVGLATAERDHWI